MTANESNEDFRHLKITDMNNKRLLKGMARAFGNNASTSNPDSALLITR
jgi:hypothetical protein